LKHQLNSPLEFSGINMEQGTKSDFYNEHARFEWDDVMQWMGFNHMPK